MNKLDIKALGLAIAICWALGVLFLGWAGAFGWGKEAVEVAASFYIGFAPTFIGGIIGAIWGFIDGLIGGVIIAWLYNFFTKPKK